MSPEPLRTEPLYVVGEHLSGFTTPAYAYARNNPLAYVDPDGLKPGDRFSGRWSQNQAAVDALRWIKKWSDTKGWEYGGMVCEDTATGEHFATDAQTDRDAKQCSPENSPCPSGSRPVGVYHTHLSGGPNSEQFSSWDLVGSRYGPPRDQYMSTGSGRVLKYRPNNKNFGDKTPGNEIWRFSR